MGNFTALGSDLGHERVIEIAKDLDLNDRQLTIIGKGEGVFTAGVIRELASNCEQTRTAGAADHIAKLWDDVDGPDWEPLGVMITCDVQHATDKMHRRLC